MAEVLEAVDETISAMKSGAGASGGQSGSKAQSLSNRLWESLSAHVYVYLHQTRLSDVIHNELAPCPAVPSLLHLVDDDSHFLRNFSLALVRQGAIKTYTRPEEAMADIKAATTGFRRHHRQARAGRLMRRA